MVERRSSMRMLSILFAAVLTSAIAAGAAPTQATAVVTLGGGCFWCLEAVFAELQGVLKVESGYAGGHVPNPTYAQVADGDTGHAEVVQITFDPGVVTLATILKVYFTIHDPTTLNRQGNDVGPQYRSIAFYRDAAQKAAIDDAIRAAAGSHEWGGAIVTEVKPFTVFYPAGNYHQEYFKRHGEQPYCQLVIAPKVAKFRKQFHDFLK
jgi:peptide-methionine (S)-S-oxide reductase